MDENQRRAPNMDTPKPQTPNPDIFSIAKKDALKIKQYCQIFENYQNLILEFE